MPVEPNIVENEPAGTCEQTEAPAVAEKEPAAQRVETVDPEAPVYDPAGTLEHGTKPFAEKAPAAHNAIDGDSVGLPGSGVGLLDGANEGEDVYVIQTLAPALE